MAKIFSVLGRAGIGRVVNPLGRTLVRAGISPDVVTVIGTCGVLVGALGFAARGHLLVGLIIITVSVCTDMLDGAMARARGYSTPFGAFLDSTMDRIADAAVFGSVAFWLGNTGHPASMAAALICLAAGQVVSYAKARAQSVGIECNVGIAERAERLVLIGVGALLYVVGVPYVFDVALWVLAALSLFTAGQRIVHVYKQSAGQRTPLGGGPAAPPRERHDDVAGSSR
ncbi:phosphatidylinositol phosphate synthase [Actinocatenispora rupis]|uniref:Phosphatidylinositol phosphate synthase n=1 Tax=Actinocatenispora rupis TaxID=519421 RepID=A0A8J3IW04_9ACTN|nr:CDP-alcohol phosphatidyltransferase family protein [Actinocatenispora rupis]GID09630.1 CDP-diacylglycerol--glycerol-3-phosphate 3-phosphatidyltransferase [Actinocatenispora rupis]